MMRERAERLAEQLCVSLGKSMDEVLGASELDTERAFLKRKLADWFQAELLAYRAEQRPASPLEIAEFYVGSDELLEAATERTVRVNYEDFLTIVEGLRKAEAAHSAGDGQPDIRKAFKVQLGRNRGVPWSEITEADVDANIASLLGAAQPSAAAGQGAQGWVSVKDQKPPPGQFVWVMWRWDAKPRLSRGPFNRDVTHWQPTIAPIVPPKEG